MTKSLKMSSGASGTGIVGPRGDGSTLFQPPVSLSMGHEGRRLLMLVVWLMTVVGEVGERWGRG